MSDEDISLDEKRVHEARRGTSQVFVASTLGLAHVAVSDDQIGRFGLAHRGETRDVAIGGNDGDRVAIATPDDVLVGAGGGADDDGDDVALAATDFGPAAALSFADTLLAAAPDGRIARYDGDSWTTIGTVEAPVVATDGALLATAEGVVRVKGDDLVTLAAERELADLRGVAAVEPTAAAGPFAATAVGLFCFDDGEWHEEAAGDAVAVASDDDRSVAVVDGTVHEREADGTWQSLDCPATDVVDVAVLGSTYAITGDGTLLVDPTAAKDGATGWASRSLGLPDVASIAVSQGDV